MTADIGSINALSSSTAYDSKVHWAWAMPLGASTAQGGAR